MITAEQGKPSLRTHSVWILCAKVIGFVLSVLLPLLTVRYLSQHSVGVYRQAFLVVGNAVSILPLGFSMSAYYFLNREPEKRSLTVLNILLFNFTVGGIAFLTLFFFPQILGGIFSNEELSALAPSIGLVIWLWIFSNFLETVALANQEAKLAAGFIVAAQFTKMVFMAGAVILFASVEAFIYAATLQAALQTVVLLVYLHSRYPGFWRRFNWKFFKEQLVYALPFGLAGLLYTSQTDIHNYFVSHNVTPAEFAVYAQGCFQIPLIWILYESISSVVIPRMSELQSKGKNREMLLLTVSAMQKLAFIYFPLFFFLMIVAYEFITTLFTQEYAQSVPIFRINLILLPFIAIMVDPIGRSFKEMGRFLLKLRATIVVVLVASLWFVMSYLSLKGVIGLVVCAIIFEQLASVWKAARMLGVTRADFKLLETVGKTAVAASITAIIFFPIYLFCHTPLLNLSLRLTGEVLSFVRYEKAVELLGGLFFLGICGAVFGATYLILGNFMGLIETQDKDRIAGLWRRVVLREAA